jgi:hypothetical protein
MKTPRYKFYKLLVFLFQSEKSWQHIALNFVTGFPPSARKKRVYNTIFVIIDRFSRMIRYISIIKNIDISDLIDFLYEEIVVKFDISRLIINDRGSIFILN